MMILHKKKELFQARKRKKRETRLELATTCLEGRDSVRSAYQASLQGISLTTQPATAQPLTPAGGRHAK